MAKITYKNAGVDLDSYRDAMARLPRLMRRTFSPRVMPREGGFAGLFRLDFPGRLFARDYQEPVLVACTDGVGTKVKIAQAAGRHETIGIDLVAMCVNDAICSGAEPLFFLDYVAMSRDDPPRLEAVVQGISDGCLAADCALLGGETAIMPDVYGVDDYDLAGFCVGVVEKRHLIDGRSITEGDAVIGVASSGLHANGYSLVRKIVFATAGLDVHEMIPHLDCTVAQVLLEPTRIYARALHRVLGHYRVKNVVHGIAHVTGGGLCENLQRVVPRDVNVVIKPDSWSVPGVFDWLQQLGDIDREEMHRVFNLGIGLVLVVSAYHANQILNLLAQCGHNAWLIGRVTSGEGRVYRQED